MGFLSKLQTLFRSEKLDVQARFELLREAVSGTMCDFYKARDRRNGQIVGLKIGDRKKVDAFESRFKQLNKPTEGEIAFSLKHPRIVETLEYGRTKAGEQYMVMEFLDGPGLHMLIRERSPLLAGKRMSLLRQMSEAVAAVHKAGYIHRDVCPRNFICSPDATTIKLIDFGLTLPATRNFMQPGNRMGTPAYMAPEVVRRRWTNQQVDLFALGVSAYQLLTLELPWPLGDGSGQVALLHDTQEPTDIHKYLPDLDQTLAAAVMSSMAPKPDGRPESVDAFLRSIRDFPDDAGG